MTTITVTAEHIAKGEPGSCDHCPVALAIQDALPDLPWSMVGPKEITVGSADGVVAEISLPTPREALFFMLLFDSGDHVQPFTFELDFPAATS